MRCIINVSTNKYRKGQERLSETLKGNTDAHLLLYTKESDVEAPTHQESMYGFKPMAFQKAYELGFTTVLWLDASMYILKDLNPIFEHIEEHGYFWQDSGWENDRWTTPEAEEYFGTNQGRMISSGVVGLDLYHPDASDFLYLWLGAMQDGMFNGSHEVTRHDQLCASLIIENMSLNITPNNTYWQYGKPNETMFHENILIIADGIC